MHAETTKPSLLIIEDDPMVAAALGRTLTEGFDVRVVADGRLGVDTALTEPPDAILLDVTLPGLDGRDVLARLRKDDSMNHTVIVVMSGHDEQHERHLALELGADDFEGKPMLGRVLLAKLLHLIKKRRAQMVAVCA